MSRFDPAGALETLHRHGVRFVVVGGIAGVLRGSPSVTSDLDLCYDRQRENVERLAAALRDMRARLRDVDDVPFKVDAPTLLAGDHFTFVTRFGDVDCLGTPAGTGGYDDLARTAEAVDLGGVDVLVASLDDLIHMKRSTGRPKDRAELEILGALRDEVE